jgi:hypothetical protein
MRWTRKLPAVPGLYWYRFRDLPPEQVTVRGNRYRDQGLIFLRPGRTLIYTLDAAQRAFWYGPIADGAKAPKDEPLEKSIGKAKRKRPGSPPDGEK